MKKIVLPLFLALFTVLSVSAQDEEMQTIFGNNPIKVGGFAGPFMSFTMVDGQFAHMMGG
ncbi:MAG: hypothetical protein HC906_16780, partial [Bacteroidales bacterium]|nr:hypothetical protein [Bacteroidales bacterium]